MDEMKTEKTMDRRSFLRSTAAAGASLVLSPEAFGSSKTNDINVALLGAGEQGQVLADICCRMPAVRFRAVCDIWTSYNQRKISRRLKAYGHQHNTYTDYREMLDKEKDLDAVIIATPDFWHAEHTISCLKAGLHVYCEKQMSNSLEGARKMVRATRQTGKLLQIGHQRRSNPRYIHCCEKLIKQAKLPGKITTVNAQWNCAAQQDLGWPKKYPVDETTLRKYGFESMHQFRNWRWYKNLGGGPLADLGSHQIDVFNWFLEARPKSVMAGGGTDYYDKQNHQWYDNAMAIYEYQTAQGTVRAFYQALTSNSNGGYYETFMGDKGTLQISESAARSALYREPSAPAWDKWVEMGYLTKPRLQQPKTKALLDVRETIAPPAYGLAVKMGKKYHQPHLENFFEAIAGKAKLNCPAELGYQTMVTVLKANEAVEAGCKLKFKDDEFEP